MDTSHFRTVRSFVRRGGRMTPSQRHGLENYWPQYGLDYQESMVDINNLFIDRLPITFEIGFGMGESLLQQSQQEPDSNFIGIEVHQPGVGKLIHELKSHNASNVKVISHDAIEVLQTMIPDHTLSRVQLYFPDPWHKKKHHKRRIIQHDFLSLLAKKLNLSGVFHFATDWLDYHEHALEIINESSLFSKASEEMSRPLIEARPKTRFEQRGLRLGHQIYDHIFRVEPLEVELTCKDALTV